MWEKGCFSDQVITLSRKYIASLYYLWLWIVDYYFVAKVLLLLVKFLVLMD